MEHFDIDFTLGGILFALLLVLVTFWIAWRNGFFRLPPPSRTPPVTFTQTLGAFLVYLICGIILLPVFFVVLIFLITGEISTIKKLSTQWMSWAQVFSLYVIFFLMIAYCFWIRPQTRYFIFWGEGDKSVIRFLKGIGMGFVGWAVSYPFVLLVGLFTKGLSLWIWGDTKVEQVAVKELELTRNNPILFALMVVLVVAVVPFMEELLFRGFLQNFIKRKCGRKWAITLTALIFAVAHYAYSQGIGNFQLILSLWVLALFLSFVYERERTLWASIGLHMTFNGLNVLMIVFAQ